jgi:hypothetical protein
VASTAPGEQIRCLGSHRRLFYKARAWARHLSVGGVNGMGNLMTGRVAAHRLGGTALPGATDHDRFE